MNSEEEIFKAIITDAIKELEVDETYQVRRGVYEMYGITLFKASAMVNKVIYLRRKEFKLFYMRSSIGGITVVRTR